MDKTQEKFILNLMKRHNYMVVATMRPDGFPQATKVGYANEGFDLYFSCDKSSQKAKNIRKCDKVSATIDRDTRDWDKIKGLSLGGHAQVLKGKGQREHAFQVLLKKFPLTPNGKINLRELPAPETAAAAPGTYTLIAWPSVWEYGS